MSGRFQVDPGRLAELVDRIDRFDTHLDDALREVDRRIGELRLVWSGAAAEEHRKAHTEWTDGAQQMREGLLAMRRIAATARANYTGAAAANTDMWRQARG